MNRLAIVPCVSLCLLFISVGTLCQQASEEAPDECTLHSG